MATRGGAGDEDRNEDPTLSGQVEGQVAFGSLGAHS